MGNIVPFPAPSGPERGGQKLDPLRRFIADKPLNERVALALSEPNEVGANADVHE